MNASFWINAGLGGAVVLVVELFLRYMHQERHDRRVEREAFIRIITNHLEHERRAMEDLTAAIKALRHILETKCR